MRPLILFLLLTLISCYRMEEADLIVHNARIQTMDPALTVYEAMAIKNGRIIELGPEFQIRNKYKSLEQFDAGQKWIFPGLIDGHCHFLGYGLNKLKVDLSGTGSFEEVLQRVKDFAGRHTDRKWIVGRGWDQNDWETKEYPDNEELNEMIPDRPVLLQRIDGHAALINEAAVRAVGLDIGRQIAGGQMIIKDGKFTGILVDNAVTVFQDIINEAPEEQKREALLQAQRDCFSEGLTGVHDAGLDVNTIELMERMIDEGELKIRLNVMVSDNEANLSHFSKNGPIVSDRLHVHTIKVYADGALGSRGAWLKEPYHDHKEHVGLKLHERAHLDSVAQWCIEHDFQMATHCIGDAANELLLDVYGKHLKGTNDRRWRIEHAQIVDPRDMDMFGEFNVLPSVQPTHATSDMYWAEDRLGNDRMNRAYSYRALRKQNGILLLGTDFPVEPISPMMTFHAAVERTDKEDYPEDGFRAEQALTPEEALRGMTIENAIGGFQENDIGTLETGKFADFIVLNEDLLNLDKKAHEVSILKTFVSGEMVFDR